MTNPIEDAREIFLKGVARVDPTPLAAPSSQVAHKAAA